MRFLAKLYPAPSLPSREYPGISPEQRLPGVATGVLEGRSGPGARHMSGVR
jgi:hypothetical protein